MNYDVDETTEGLKMTCDVGKATEGLENHSLCRRSDGKVGNEL